MWDPRGHQSPCTTTPAHARHTADSGRLLAMEHDDRPPEASTPQRSRRDAGPGPWSRGHRLTLHGVLRRGEGDVGNGGASGAAAPPPNPSKGMMPNRTGWHGDLIARTRS